MGVELVSNQLAVTGNTALNPFSTEQFFTDIDSSGTISIGLTSGNATIEEDVVTPDVLTINNPYGETIFNLDDGSGLNPTGFSFGPTSNLGATPGWICPTVAGAANIGDVGFEFQNGYFLGEVSVGNTTVIKTDRITMEANLGDVGTPAAGDFWYNAASGKLKYRHGSTNYEVLDATTGVLNPGTKANNDLLQYSSGTGLWEARGAVVGDPILGTICTSGLRIVGGGSASPILFDTDAANDIGASGATRPRSIYVATSVVVNGQTVVKATDSATGADINGTYPTSLSVYKLRGYALESGAPLAGEHLTYNATGTQLEYVRNCWDLIAETDAGSSSSQISIGSLAGDTHEVYMLVMWGYFNTGGANDYVWIQFNGDTGNNYVWSRHDQGWDSGGGTSHGVSNANAVGGCRILDTDKSKSAYFQVVTYIDAKVNTQNHYRTVNTKANWVATDGNTAYDQSYVGGWKNSASAITSMLLRFGASTNRTFTGNLRLYGLRKY